MELKLRSAFRHISFPSRQCFITDTGKFPEDLISAPDLALWNTIIGEGSAKGPANSLLIVIEVAGDGGPNVYTSDELVVTTEVQGKPPSRKQLSHLEFSPSGQHFEALWLDNIGCAGPVTIAVQVNHKRLDFQCGE